MDFTSISLLLSGAVAIIQFLTYLHAKVDRKETLQNKYSKAADVELQISTLKSDIDNIHTKLDTQQLIINNIENENSVCIMEHKHSKENNENILRGLERLADKLEDLR